MQDNRLKKIGMWVAMSIVSDGHGFPALMPSLYEYMADGDIMQADISNSEIADPAISCLVDRVCGQLHVCSYITNLILGPCCRGHC